MTQDGATIPYGELSEREWNRFIEESAGGWVTDHSDWMRFFERDCGYENHSFAIVVEGRIRLTFSLFLVPNLLSGKRFVSGPFFDHGGPIIETGWEHLAAEAQEHVLDLATFKNVRQIEIRDSKVHLEDTVQRDDYCNFLLELGRPEEEIFAGLGENVRRAIRKSKKTCSALVSRGTEDLQAVWNLYDATMLDHGTPPWGKRFFGAFSRELETGRARLITVTHGDALLGGALFWGNGKVARLEISASPSLEARRLQVNSFLFWQAIISANTLGYESIELTRTLKRSPHYDFKKRWGGREVPLPFTYLGRESPPPDPRDSFLAHLASLGRYLPPAVMRKIGDPIRIRLAM